MSRTVSSNVEAAIEDAYSAKIRVKAEVDPSRTFFSSLDHDYPYDAGDYSTPTEDPVGQCVCYDTTEDDFFTFVVDSSTGSIYGMVKGSSTKNDLSLTADAESKPAVYPLGTGSVYLYYWDGSNLKRVTVNLSTWGTSGSTTVTVDNLPTAWTITGGSPHVLSNGHLVFVYLTSIGGLGVGYYDDSNWTHWDGRFISPNTLSTEDMTINSAAALLDGNIFVYQTDFATGEVKGVEYKPTEAIWSDSFVAMPADLSRFFVGNAIVENGYVHVSGQFHRTDDLEDAEVYSLILRSLDGRTFSWDRFTLLSTEGFCFQIDTDSTAKKVWASDRNSVGVADMSYFFVSIPTNRVTLQPPSDIVSFSLSGNNTGTLKVQAGSETYLDHAVVKKGNRVTLYMGYDTATGIEYTQYAQYIIDRDTVTHAAGRKEMILTLLDEGQWKTNEIAFPFYAEILSKVTSHDDCDERDKMYPVATKRPDAPSFLYADFWGNNYWDGDGSVSGTEFRFRGTGSGCERTTTDNYQGATDQLLMRTIALNEHPLLTDYPELDGTTLGVSLYGWEMTKDTARPNSTWTVYAVTAPEDDLEDKTITQGTLTSTYAVWEQDYFDSESGSDPITWNVTGLTDGHLLLYLGFSISNTDSSQSESIINPERLELTGLSFNYFSDVSSRGWSVEQPTGESSEYLKMPKTGLPSVMFLSKPYTSFNFSMAAEFFYDAGSEALSYGTIGWGVVGLAEDGTNLIVARYNKLTSDIELLSLREGVENELDTYTPGAQPEDIMLVHRDGLFYILIRESGTTWTGPVMEYYWDEITDGVISTSDTGIMHMGIYGAAVPPSFVSAGVNVLNMQGIGVPTIQDPVTTLTGFPASGKIIIDEVLYSYSSKVTGATYYGPYQGRQSESYRAYSEGGTDYSGWATEVALYKPDNSATLLDGLIFCTNNGYAWEIINSDWTVTHYTGGVPNYLRNRSRHYCEDHAGDVVGLSTRVYMVPGLMGLLQEDDNVAYSHVFGSLVALYGSDEIFCKKAVGTTLDADSTVKDMLKYICGVASIEATFNGDWTSASESVGTTPVEIADTVELLPGGFNVTFTLPVLASSAWAEVYASNLFLNTTEVIHLGIKNTSGLLEVYSDPDGASATETVQTGIAAGKSRECRVYFHGEFATVYIDGRACATFAYGEDNLTWPTTQTTLYLKASSTINFTNVVVDELFDWREAIYVESEITAASALGSVIQERPVEIQTTDDGSLDFSYNLVRDTITLTTAVAQRIIHSHSRTRSTSKDAGSDAVVYYADVDFASDPTFATDEGFITRVMNLASLEHGANIAARMVLKRARERQTIISVVLRPDMRIEPGDIYDFSVILPDTSTQIDVSLVVENIGMVLTEGRYKMNISGRENSS